MHNKIEEDLEKNRLSLEELRQFPKYKNVTDEEGEAIIDDVLAFARMVLEIID